jgi:uncharacterized protein (TIGR02996 family)
MQDEAFLQAIQTSPQDIAARMGYANWLRELGDIRCQYFEAEQSLRETPLGDSRRQRLGANWREIRARMDPQWLALVEPNSPVPAWMTAADLNPEVSGIRDWIKWAKQSHFEWILLAALAPLESVARTIISLRTADDPDKALSNGTWRQNVPVKKGKSGEAIGRVIPLVQLENHAWTIAMYATFHYNIPASNAAECDAREISDRLGTLALTFAAEDTSSAEGYELYECGELIEYGEDAPGDRTFASKRRPPPSPITSHPFFGDLFGALGLYIPGFYATSEGIRYGRPKPPPIARADLLSYQWQYREYELSDLVRRNDGFEKIYRMDDDGPFEEFDPPESLPDYGDDVPF